MECTILVHIQTDPNGASIQKRKHLQWIALDQIQNLNNEVPFTLAHNLLKKMGEATLTRQKPRSTSASFKASPQAARKKRLTRLDMTIFMNPEIDAQVAARDALVLGQGGPNEECEASVLPRITLANPPGSISHMAARSKLTYV
ncbi:unnamed protein product [Sphagnum balticum]